MVYYDMAEKFTEFELEERAQKLQCEQLPLHSALPQALHVVPNAPSKGSQQPLEEPATWKTDTKLASGRPHRTARNPVLSPPGARRELPAPGEEAVSQYIEIMESLQRETWAGGCSEAPPGAEEGDGDAGGVGAIPELIEYIEGLCSKDSFISK
ncbi:NUT family member 1-like, partial [Hemiscyllium ocellatum]|uniref:NUT family member 1-like n=1 Tax=Hemiscyllium ocellatum TaxID=170820 RepID=UPI002967443E